FGYGEEMQEFFDLDLLGGFVLKGIYTDPRPGNEPPRLYETPSGLLNSIGLPGAGVDGLKTIIKRLAKTTRAPIIVNVCGASDEEYLEVSEAFDVMDEVAILELNISCPNIKKGGTCPAQNSEQTYRVVKMIKDNTRKPLMVKLTPNVHNIASIACAAEAAGADSLSLVNTFLGIAIDVKKRAPVFKNIVAGLSGPAIKPLALKLVWEVARAVSIPVIGIGGIASGGDVLEFIMAGAAAVQTGTINMVEPDASVRIIREIESMMKELNIKNLSEIKGAINR
ncbi:MAG: dihydroorotate dehydrogenase, partial [bacterium]|nr:dihydroorotate dehydrogenase [bacterium]